MKNSLFIMILSYILKWIIEKIFFIHGSYIALTKGELKSYWFEIAIINDVSLNVVGRYALNQHLRKDGHEFGNRLETISSAMGRTNLEPRGIRWVKRLNKWDKNHVENAVILHKEKIALEYESFSFS